MSARFWEQVRANGLRVPQDRPLAELTTELAGMLGDPDPEVREATAHATLVAWLAAGVYDELLEGFGDGMAAGLRVGLGESGTDTVFRRTLSARVLTACLERDNRERLVPPGTVLGWGDRLAGWLVRERDLRGHVVGKGWARAVAHGADALGALASSAAIGRMELTVLLDVLADRLTTPSDRVLVDGETDRLAAAAMQILRRGLVGIDLLEPWLARLSSHATPATGRTAAPPDQPPDPVATNVQAFLRALHLQLAVGPNPPADRADLLLAVIQSLRETNPGTLGSTAG